MDKKLKIDQMKDLLNEDYFLKLAKKFDSYDRIKEHSSFINKISFKKYHEERIKNIPQHAIFFIKDLIDKIDYILNNEEDIVDNKYLHIDWVICLKLYYPNLILFLLINWLLLYINIYAIYLQNSFMSLILRMKLKK